MRKAIAVGIVLLTAAASSCGHAKHTAPGDSAQATPAAVAIPAPTPAPHPAPVPAPPPPDAAPAPEFAPVSKLMNDAVAAGTAPGGVVVIGHGGKVVFHQAYGSRKRAGEPGLDGSPAPAEPMTEDTIFDIASLTKPLATATAVMQLYEQGKVAFDDPVQKYLPDFNTTNDPQRANVTVRMLLTHTSGEPEDVRLDDPWGLDRADKAEGIRRALTTPLQSPPGEYFGYADINFILLGALIEKLAGVDEDVYVQQNVFAPLGMQETRYLPPAKACGPHLMRGAAIGWAPTPIGGMPGRCPAGAWSTSLLPRIAPTVPDDESRNDPGKNPDFGFLLRGAVFDPSTRRMGGVTGHAGVFSPAHDVSLYAQALLDRLANRPSEFPLKQATLELMTTPEQPGHTAGQVEAANNASREAIAKTPNREDPLLAPRYPAIRGQNLRGFGWDIDTAYAGTRGMIFPVGSFGHTGFTGTSLWIDPSSDIYVILFTSAIDTRDDPPIAYLRGDVSTAAARALQ
ncbi:MAG: beta-lactamase family protein [Mycobacterium sp.]|nr:beta-lactamase family protein [Mycobacterium sp.]